jgi:hypothetical protein
MGALQGSDAGKDQRCGQEPVAMLPDGALSLMAALQGDGSKSQLYERPRQQCRQEFAYALKDVRSEACYHAALYQHVRAQQLAMKQGMNFRSHIAAR